jgi:hypothetical protein
MNPALRSPLSALSSPVITIDGPSASGKGTVAERVAAALGFHFLDSGALSLDRPVGDAHGVALDDDGCGGMAAAAATFRDGAVWLADENVTRVTETWAGARKWRRCRQCAPPCSSASAPIARRPDWWPTAATGAR